MNKISACHMSVYLATGDSQSIRNSTLIPEKKTKRNTAKGADFASSQIHTFEHQLTKRDRATITAFPSSHPPSPGI